MTVLSLACGTLDFVLDASQSSATFNSLNDINYVTTAGKHIFSGGVRLSGMAAGFASFDASGNISSVAGSLFDSSAPQSVSAAWTFGSTISVSGQATFAGKIVNSGIASVTSTIGVPSLLPPSGYKFAVIKDSTGEIGKLV